MPKVTFFRTMTARTKEEKDLTPEKLVDLIQNTHARAKNKLPWLKLATFGDKRSAKGCLRHDKNMIAVSGVELDYDKEKVSFDDALVVTRKAKLNAILYTSSSYTPETPHWRILVFCRAERTPAERDEMVEAVSALYGDVFGEESRVRSQSYYYGYVDGNKDNHHAILFKGNVYADDLLKSPFERYGDEMVVTVSDALDKLGRMEDGNIHNTQLSVTASLLNAGWDLEDVVEKVLHHTKKLGGDDWDWNEEERNVRKLCEDWEAKRNNVVALPKQKRKIAAKIQHIVIAADTLKELWASGRDVLRTSGQWWFCNDGLWSPRDEKIASDEIDRAIRKMCEEREVVPTVKLTNETKAELKSKVTQSDVEWDAHGKLATLSGLVDDDGDVEDIRPDHMVTSRMTVAFDPDARCPQWEAALLDVSESKDVAKLIQEVAGAALYHGKDKAQCRAFIAYGPSNSGKTVIIEALAGLVSGTRIAVPISEVDSPHGLMPFRVDDPWVLDEAFDAGKWMMSSKVKSLISMEPIPINIKNSSIISRRWCGSVFWATNYPPQFREITRAIVNRIICVPFNKVYDPRNPVGVAKTARDAGYDRLSDFFLQEEGPGILNWAIAGWKRLKARGYYDLPKVVEDMLEEVHEEGNAAIGFFRDCCDVVEDGYVVRQDIYGAFSAWWEENFADTAPSPRTFWASLRAMSVKGMNADKNNKRRVNGTSERVVTGIHLSKLGLDFWTSWSSSRRTQNMALRSVSQSAGEVNRGGT